MLVTTPSACIQAEKDDVAKVVLMPGDPLRAKFIAENFLEEPVLFNTVRNMLGYTGTYKGKKISVMGHGMGVPSVALYTYELYQFFDVDAIIRIGSAGAIAEDVHVRDVVVAMTASTNSNYAQQFDFQGQLAPTATYELLADAVQAGKALGANMKVGSVYTGDPFYNAQSAYYQQLRDFGMLCVEMETAGLYWNAQYLHKKALSILTISDDVFTGEELSPQDRQDSFHQMMEIALETAWKAID